MRRFSFFVAALCLSTAASACLLRVRQHPDLVALNAMDDGRHSGPAVETLREAARRVGCQIETQPLPWARALVELEAGRLDVLPDAHQSVEREGFAHFSATTWPTNTLLWVRAEDLAQVNGLRTLEAFMRAGKRLGVQKGALYGGSADVVLADARYAGQLQRVPHRSSLWKMASGGRIDGLLAERRAGRVELRALGLETRVVATSLSVGAEPSRTAYSRRTVSEDLVRKIDAALREMARDGSLAAIEARLDPQPSAPAPATAPRPGSR